MARNIKTIVCVILGCDNGCDMEASWGDVVPHFSTIEEAEKYATTCGWAVIAGRSAQCPDCVERGTQEVCGDVGHPWDGWGPSTVIDGVVCRRRCCCSCDAVELDPPFEHMSVLRAAAAIVDAVPTGDD